MEYQIKEEKDYVILSLGGRLLTDKVDEKFPQKVDAFIEDGKVNFIVVLKGLEFINSSGLGVLLRVLTKSRKAGGDVVLTEIPEQLDRLLVITKLNKVFSTSSTLDEAKNKF